MKENAIATTQVITSKDNGGILISKANNSKEKRGFLIKALINLGTSTEIICKCPCSQRVL